MNEIDHLLDESKETDDIMHNLALIPNKLSKVMKKSYCCQKYQIISLKLLILDLEKHQVSSDVGSHTSQPVYENRGITENNNTKKGMKENKNRKNTNVKGRDEIYKSSSLTLFTSIDKIVIDIKGPQLNYTNLINIVERYTKVPP